LVGERRDRDPHRGTAADTGSARLRGHTNSIFTCSTQSTRTAIKRSQQNIQSKTRRDMQSETATATGYSKQDTNKVFKRETNHLDVNIVFVIIAIAGANLLYGYDTSRACKSGCNQVASSQQTVRSSRPVSENEPGGWSDDVDRSESSPLLTVVVSLVRY
jgi:hypothetical protein